MELDTIDQNLIDGWQRDFPLTSEPFAVMGSKLGVGEREVLERLSRLSEAGAVSRIGAVLRPNTAGASTLAAIAAPPDELERVAALVNEEPGVNHNYEREHHYNLWFVVTGANRAAVDASLERIKARTGLQPMDLPMVRGFHLDLGFPIFSEAGESRKPATPLAPPPPVSDEDRLLLAALTEGMEITVAPFRKIANRLGRDEAEVIAAIDRLTKAGVISRFGVVVRHHALGYRANAMTVWDIAADKVEKVAKTFCGHSFVSLCYERPRRLPAWRYNLFCMIHGQDRSAVLAQVERLREEGGAAITHHAVLFSTRCFRQRGARLAA